jgi:hypothetical protein
MRLRMPSIPFPRRIPMPRRVTLRWKLAGLLIFIGVLVVALAMVSLASLAKVSDSGRHNFAHVTQPLAALGTARALVSENAALADRHILEDTVETKRPLEQRTSSPFRRTSVLPRVDVGRPTFGAPCAAQPAVNCSSASSGRMRWSIAPWTKKLRRRSPLNALAAAAMTMPWSSAR